ncbi:hypothetical protein KY343_05350 [Candidatus Woesearchaeota archaeon]|nr:hypothetical protein [Candidatus Woesearchaeota archaeon]
MAKKEIQERYLIGFRLLIFFLVISIILHIRDLFAFNQTYFFNILFAGITFKLYIVFLIILKLVLIYGLIDRYKWSFYLFLFYNIFQLQSMYLIYTLRNDEILLIFGLLGFLIDIAFLIYVIIKRDFLYRTLSKNEK